MAEDVKMFKTKIFLWLQLCLDAYLSVMFYPLFGNETQCKMSTQRKQGILVLSDVTKLKICSYVILAGTQ